MRLNSRGMLIIVLYPHKLFTLELDFHNNDTNPDRRQELTR
jgi:hypothetical protein